jgi:short-subunit dehydrogenase
MDLAGRICVVTGASRGLGVGIAVKLASERAHVVLSARDEAGLNATADKVRAAGGGVTVVPGDVTKADDRARLLDAVAKVGPLDVLVNNAGIEIPLAVVDQSPEQIARQIDVNLTAPLLLTRAVVPDLVSRGRGAVVMVSSMSGKSPTPYNAVYTATKHALCGFTSSLRIELAGTGVHAGVVCPSFVADAGMWADSGAKAPRAMREVPPERVADAVRKVIDGRAEILVTPGPVRPLLAIGQLFPSLDEKLLRMLGVLAALKDRAARASQA